MPLSPSQMQQIAGKVDRFLLDDPQPRQLSDHNQAVWCIIHNCHVNPSQWPLEHLRKFIDALSEPTTPPPISSNIQAEQQSPRTVKANSCMPDFRKLDCWPFLICMHNHALTPKDHDDFIYTTGWLAKCIIENIDKLGSHLPELFRAVKSQSELGSALHLVYSELKNRIASDDDRTLALVLVHVTISYPVGPSSAKVADTNTRFASQFGRPYQGHAPSRFLNFVSRLNSKFNQLKKKHLKPYFRGTPIVQSSGTGKTHMVLECRHLTPLLYVCFRPNNAIGNTKAGFPFPDNGIIDFFLHTHLSHPFKCNLHVACFLSALFQTLAESLDKCPTNKAKHLYLLQLNHLDLNAGQNQEHHNFFADATLEAQNLLSQATGDLLDEKKYEETFRHYIYAPYSNLQCQISWISSHLHSLRGQTGATCPPPVIVAIDECIEMMVVGHNDGIHPLNGLHHAWCYLGDLPHPEMDPTFWLMLMSTSSSAAHLVEHIDAKTLIRSKTAVPLPTFVGVGFDALLAKQQSLSCASKAFLHQHIIAYGCPLWSSLENHSFWEVAKLKLICDYDFRYNDARHCFSVMASRLALNLVPTCSPSSPLFTKQKIFMDMTVDRHMHITTRITDKAAMYINSPSEPVLAIAASLFMLFSDS